MNRPIGTTPTRETAVLFGSLGFLAGLIVGLASCAPDPCQAQTTANAAVAAR